ncbi:hypothetical protein A2Z67_01810 [Candidatus Woesebacteria bacterium RBG_13_36_22]|uniref:Fibronectin type-III domain-containing protein n=1 Tax=Candidatus Woesebacteria bacterium RBG_13_36_22 TaxID=1802478 RepID=A0A1F7X0N0_9BACT|nr:MAG: hypothetical protein A2Z67_01810 [Candidatus Woesebacteria bacterium RBG_13_36_22]
MIKRLFRILLIAAILSLSALSIIPSGEAHAIGLEDFLTYTEVDEGTDITVAPLEVEWTTELRTMNSMVYKDFGANYFDESWQVDFGAQLVENTGGNGGFYFALTNTIPTGAYDVREDGTRLPAIFLYEVNQAPYDLFWSLQINYDSGINQGATTAFEPVQGQFYWVTIKFDGTVGDYGQLSASYYTNVNRDFLIQTDTMDCDQAVPEFRYLFAHMSLGAPTGTNTWSGQTTAMYVTEIGEAPPEPTNPPVVTTYAATIHQDYVYFQGWGTDDFGELLDAGFEVGTESGVYTDNLTAENILTNLFDLTASTDLETPYTYYNWINGETYYFRAWAQNANGVGYGTERSFTFTPRTIIVSASAATLLMGDTGNSTATFDVTVTAGDAADNVTARMCLLTDYPAWTPEVKLNLIATNVISAFTTIYTFSTWDNLSETAGELLLPDTWYYYQGIASISGNEYFSSVRSAKTDVFEVVWTNPVVTIESIQDVSSEYGQTANHNLKVISRITSTSAKTRTGVQQGVNFSLNQGGGILLSPVFVVTAYNLATINSTFTVIPNLQLFWNNQGYDGSQPLYFQAYVDLGNGDFVRSSVYQYGGGGSGEGGITPLPDSDEGNVVKLINWLKGSLGIQGMMGTWAVLVIFILIISLVFGVSIMSTDVRSVKIGGGVAWLMSIVATVGLFVFTGQLGIWPVVILVAGVVGLIVIVVGTKLSGSSSNG